MTNEFFTAIESHKTVSILLAVFVIIVLEIIFENRKK